MAVLVCINDVIDAVTDQFAQFKNYCQELAGGPVPIVADEEAKARLPVFLGQAYEPLKGDLFERPWTFLLSKGRSHPTPGEAANHARLAAKTLKADIVLVFSTLASFDRKRLVQKRVPFIVPGRQVFLPGHFIDLRERGMGADTERQSDRLSMPSQVLLLFHLLKQPDGTRMPLHEWASALGYSRMTLSRAAQELVGADLAKKTGHGKAVLLGFGLDRRQLWQHAAPLLSSPVSKRMNAIIRGDTPPEALSAGITALAEYSDIATGRQRVLAMSSPSFASAKKQGSLEVIRFPEADTAIIEEWRYAPTLLSEDGRTVDRLSLYLSLHDTKDERLEGALKQVLEGVS